MPRTRPQTWRPLVAHTPARTAPVWLGGPRLSGTRPGGHVGSWLLVDGGQGCCCRCLRCTGQPPTENERAGAKLQFRWPSFQVGTYFLGVLLRKRGLQSEGLVLLSLNRSTRSDVLSSSWDGGRGGPREQWPEALLPLGTMGGSLEQRKQQESEISELCAQILPLLLVCVLVG